MDDHPPILAVELLNGNRMALYTRDGQQTAPFSPWLLVEAPEECNRAGLSGIREVVSLKGGGGFRFRAHFHTWSDFLEAKGRLSEDGIAHFSINTPVRQHLLLSGQTLFYRMRYAEVHRLQLDIETLTLHPQAPGAEIILIALSDTRGYEEILSGRNMSETELLRQLNQRIADRNPDVIEGHNIFDFDLFYISARADRLQVPLTWGRDGSQLKVGHGTRRYKVGAHNPHFRPAYIHGRHIIDTLQQVRRYDVAGRLESYGLKNAIRVLGLERKGRVFVEGKDIPRLWREDPDRLTEYALDDVRDVRVLSELVVSTEFYQTQILPYSFQDTAITGPGEKINALMVGAYLRRNLAIPRSRASKPFGGGYTQLFASGIFKRVVKADVESLYPSIMLTCGIRPIADTENAFLPMLERLTRRRLEAKAHYQEGTNKAEAIYWDGLQNSYKVLINAFYGYLAYGRANFNDYKAAEQVTAMGQDIARQLVTQLQNRDAEIIEVDTDGVYFVVPSGIGTEEDEHRFIEEVSGELPRGIHLSHDGRYRGMISLKAKNYILIGYDDVLTVKGSSLRSRRDERIFRSFIEHLAHLLIDGKTEEASADYLSLAARLQEGQVSPKHFCRWERITEKTFSNPNLRRLAAAAKGGKIGEKIAVYQKRDGSLARIETYAEDEDRDYLLRRLHDMAGRFRSLFGDAEFRRLFPLVQKPAEEQLSLF